MLRKLFLALMLCGAIAPRPAQAIPVAFLVSQFSFALGLSFSATLAFTTAALKLAASIGLSLIAQKLLAPKQRQIRAEIQQPTEKPPKRFAYGRSLAPGSPFCYTVVRQRLYLGVILNSRPSAMGDDFTVFFDKRGSEIVDGDPFDFDGPGARLQRKNPDGPGDNFGAVVNQPRIWIGRGDQIKAPDEVVADTADSAIPVLATDAWRGLTVMWVRIGYGDQETVFQRWPNSYRTQIEVLADWSLVWDPRDPAQDPDDPATWEYSNNQALCLLDALRQNPIREYRLDQLRLDTFIAGADLADEPVARFYEGGTVPRYTTNGILPWTGNEITDQVTPLAQAGAGELVKIRGKLAYSDGSARGTSYTISDLIGGGMNMERWRPGSELPTAVKASYTAPARGYEEADLPPLPLEIGSSQIFDEGIREIDLGFVTEPTQAMRVQKIIRNRLSAQRRLQCTLPPSAIKLVSGTVVDCDIEGLPITGHRWRVESVNPALWLRGEGVAMSADVTFAEEPEDLDAWNPETDEIEIINQGWSIRARQSLPVENLTAEAGFARPDGKRAVVLTFDIQKNASAAEWQWRIAGGEYTFGASVPLPAAPIGGLPSDTQEMTIQTQLLDPGFVYEFEVRAAYGDREPSAYESVSLAIGIDLDPPLSGSATGGTGQITVQFTTPNSADFAAIEFWGSNTNISAAATLLASINSAQNTVRSFTETGLGADVTRFYFARSKSSAGVVSAFTASVSATTNP